MMAFRTLLAKKPIDPDKACSEETLLGHSERVLALSKVLTERFREGIKNLLLVDDTTNKCWEKAVWVAAWMHDWGKANDHFQQMIRDTSFKQGVRHETISLMIAEDLEGWLQPLWDDLPAWAKCSVLFAISGHHLKFPDPFEDLRQGTKVTVLFSHPDFKRLRDLGRDAFQLSGCPEWEDRDYSLLRRGEIRRALVRLRNDLDQDFTDVEKVLIAAVKATLMAADLAGSALPKKN